MANDVLIRRRYIAQFSYFTYAKLLTAVKNIHQYSLKTLHIMRSMFSIEEVGEMLKMDPSQVVKELESGQLTYTFHEGEKKVTMYDLEKYMGADQTRKIVREFLEDEES